MHTITTFAMKGGAGRTTAVMTLACGFKAMGKRVAVMDCTVSCSRRFESEMLSTLQAWAFYANDVPGDSDAHPVKLVEASTCQKIEDQCAAIKAAGYDVLLIDTQHRLEEHQAVAVDLADLVVVPATGAIEAACSADHIYDILGFSKHHFGLVTGCRNGTGENSETRAAFGTHPVFRTELPRAEVLLDISGIGNIERFIASLACKSTEPGYARYNDARDAWRAVQQLTLEVHWALKGHRLEPFATEQPAYGFHREAVA